MYACFATSHRGYVTIDDARRFLSVYEEKNEHAATTIEMHDKLEAKVGSVLASEGITVKYSRGILASEVWIEMPPTPEEIAKKLTKVTETATKGAKSLAEIVREATGKVEDFATTLEQVSQSFDQPRATVTSPDEAVRVAQDDYPFTLSSFGSEVEPFDDDEWYFESELTGVRAMLVFDSEVEGSQIQIFDAQRNDISIALPDIVDKYRQFSNVKSCILDGVLIAVAAGQVELASDFVHKCATLMTDKNEIRKRVENVLIRFMAIDVLQVNGKDVTETGKSYPLSKRKAALKKMFHPNDNMAVLGFSKGEGLQRVDLSSQLGYNVIAKEADSLYTQGKTTNWLRIIQPAEKAQEDATEPEVSIDYLVLGYTRKSVLIGKRTGSIGYDYCGEVVGANLQITKEAGRALMTQIKEGQVKRNCFTGKDDKLPQNLKGFCVPIPCTIEHDGIKGGLFVNPRLTAFQSSIIGNEMTTLREAIVK